VIRTSGSIASAPTPAADGPDAWTDAKAAARATRAAAARQASGRRRGIDPTTCDRDYSVAELEFLGAMQEYKRTSWRMFPTWIEVLEVLRDLGYAKAAHCGPAERAAAMTPTARSAGGVLRADPDQIDDTPALSAGREGELAARLARGDPESRDHLVRANLRLVVHLARSFYGRGLGREDVVAEGNLGLIHAAETFDAAFGARFGAYAALLIKRAMGAALVRQGRTIRLPHHMARTLSAWGRASGTLAGGLGRRPRAEEVAAALGLPAAQAAMVASALRCATTAPTAVDGDDPIAWEGELADRHPGPEAEASRAGDLRLAAGRIGSPTGCEARIVRLRFGLDGEPPLTLAAVGGRLGITRVWVREPERRAIRQLAEAVRLARMRHRVVALRCLGPASMSRLSSAGGTRVAASPSRRPRRGVRVHQLPGQPELPTRQPAKQPDRQLLDRGRGRRCGLGRGRRSGLGRGRIIPEHGPIAVQQPPRLRPGHFQEPQQQQGRQSHPDLVVVPAARRHPQQPGQLRAAPLAEPGVADLAQAFGELPLGVGGLGRGRLAGHESRGLGSGAGSGGSGPFPLRHRRHSSPIRSLDARVTTAMPTVRRSYPHGQ